MSRDECISPLFVRLAEAQHARAFLCRLTDAGRLTSTRQDAPGEEDASYGDGMRTGWDIALVAVLSLVYRVGNGSTETLV